MTINFFYFFDVPHLLKSTRNNFFSYIFVLPDGQTNKRYLETMYNYDKTKEFKMAHKLTDSHIYPNNFQRMKVKLASQVMSHSVAVALSTCIDLKILPADAMTTVNFIKKINDLFDLLNASHLNSFNAFMNTEKQRSFLSQMTNLFQNIKLIKSDGKDVTNQVKFLNGWRLTINSVFGLWELLQAKGYNFLLTRNLNQDCLENFFGQVRNCCGNARNPTPIQFSRAFKKLFCLKYLDEVEGANCMQDLNVVLMNLTPDLINDCAQVLPIPTNNPLKVFTNDYRDIKSAEGNALVYVAGYFLKKSLAKHNCDICIGFNNSNLPEEQATIFCQQKAYATSDNAPFGHLMIPSTNIINFLIALENIFIENFNDLACKNGVGSELKKKFETIDFNHPCPDFPHDYLLSLYTRVRLYFTLKFANQNIKSCRLQKQNPKLTILKHL